MQIKVKSTPTHIITGFLGAGKTTVLNHLLSQKPKNEVWAVLMNEFGEIGIDQSWIAEHQGVAVKEVLGGCLCCTSQLPMQIALARLLSEFKPHRLFIEPTGLGHPKELVEQLSQAHWQQSLSVRQVVTVVDGHRLQEKLWEKYDIFLQQIDVADIILVSHYNQMNDQDCQQLEELKIAYAYPPKNWLGINNGYIDLLDIDALREHVDIKKQSLLTQSTHRINTSPNASNEEPQEPKTLPYHYSAVQQGFHIAGWYLPKSWCFDADQFLMILQALKNYDRIKGKINTNQGWIDLNATIRNFQVDFSAKAGLDNRLEIISHTEQDWVMLEKQMLKTKEQS